MASSSKRILPWVLIAAAIALAFWGFGSYNSMITLDEQSDNAWRQVETQYQRRLDLVPNLVSTVQGSANFEQDTLTAVTEARTNWLSAQSSSSREEQIEATQNFDSALSRLLVSVEAYPELRSTQAFQDLMVQLEGTENRIATARRDYNETVQDYNLAVRRFPGNIFASLFGFDVKTGFESADGADVAPTVDFDS